MSEAKEKKSFFANFKITDRASCEQAIKNGGIAAMISAGLTSLLAVIGFFSDSETEGFNPFDPWSLIDGVLILVLGIFIFRKSRVAATITVIYFVVSKLTMWYEMGKPAGWIMAVIFFLFYVTAMRGTYIWHSKYKGATATPAT